MEYVDNTLNTAGKTPFVLLNRVVKGVAGKVYLKNEAANPTHSISDRVAPFVMRKAIEKQMIREGGTLISALAANMTISFTVAAINEGFKVIAVLSDKESEEKVILLKALGVQIISCPNDLKPSDSRSKYAVAKRLHKRTSNSFLVDQSLNAFFIEGYYESIAKELWQQTKGNFTDIIIPVSTGTVICGISKYIKEKNKAIKVWGVDPYGSVTKKYFDSGIYDENEIYPYEVEGIGASFIGEHIDFLNVDEFVKVSDRDSAVNTSALVKEEGLFLGMSSGASLAAVHQLKGRFTKDSVVIVLATDGGARYMSKVYNEEWMRSRGFLNKSISVASDLVKDPTADVITVKTSELVSHAVARMRKYKISQIPVVDSHGFVGSVDEMSLFSAYLDDHRKDNTPILEIMNPSFPIVNSFTSVEEIASLIQKGNTAVIVALDNEKHGIITKSDVISHLQ